jgi:hypothetical protein
MSKLKIGFYSLYETEIQDSYVGTILITDSYGIPLEFKCTHSVKATSIQKALYGERLKPYIGIELCGVPLIKSITNSPDFLFVDTEYLLTIRTKITTPVILIGKADKEKLETPEEYNKDGKILIAHEYNTFEPVEIQYHPEFEKDNKNTLEGVFSICTNFDLTEPFARMKKSVEILGKSDSKFK